MNGFDRDVRQDFPLLRGYQEAYLDNAATAQRPQCVLDAMKHFYENDNANPLRGFCVNFALLNQKTKNNEKSNNANHASDADSC